MNSLLVCMCSDFNCLYVRIVWPLKEARSAATYGFFVVCTDYTIQILPIDGLSHVSYHRGYLIALHFQLVPGRLWKDPRDLLYVFWS